MSTSDDGGDETIVERFRELLADARREAYQRGYDDAVRRIVAAAGGAAPVADGPSAPAPRPAAPSPARAPAPRPAGGGDQPRRQRAKRGSLEARLVEILGAAPEGATIAEIEAAGSAPDEEPLKTPSIRVALARLLSSGRVAREGRRWRLAGDAAPAPADDDEEEEPAAAEDGARAEEDWPPAPADEDEDRAV